jgi:ketosteroid isomerase-like protein
LEAEMRSAYEIVKAHYDASQRGDLPGMLADLAPDAQWVEMDGSLCAGTHVGPDAVVERVFKVIGAEFAEFGFTLERLLDAGDDVVAVGGYHGRHRRSGKSFQVRTVHLWTVKADKIRRFEQFTDTRRLADVES